MEDHFDSVLLSDIGVKRKQNQDFAIKRPDLGLFVVADGMGGHQGGEIASKLCAETIVTFFEKNHSANPKSDQKSGQVSDAEWVQQAILSSNQAVFDLSQKESHLQGMGTTVTVLKISNHLATIAQVGDSRLYYWCPDGIWQLTRDHSLVQEKLRAGLITRAQLKTDQMKNIITRSVGYELNLNVDLFHFETAPGDIFLLCSDGLSGPVDHDLMFEILEKTSRSGLSLDEAATELVSQANRLGGDDNVTVLLVRVK